MRYSQAQIMSMIEDDFTDEFMEENGRMPTPREMDIYLQAVDVQDFMDSYYLENGMGDV